MTGRAPLPVTRAILLADAIITEAGTHKKSLIGLYSRIAAQRLPIQKRLCVYAQLADAFGEYRFQLELLNLRTNEICSKGEFGPVISRDRLLPLELVMHLPCQITEFGDYELRIAYMGNVFASRVFSVAEIPTPPVMGGQNPFETPSDDFPDAPEA